MFNEAIDAQQPATSVVFIVDDDGSVRASIAVLIAAPGCEVLAFASAQAFL
jgi:FixJ family two-component response regulator